MIQKKKRWSESNVKDKKIVGKIILVMVCCVLWLDAFTVQTIFGADTNKTGVIIVHWYEYGRYNNEYFEVPIDGSVDLRKEIQSICDFAKDKGTKDKPVQITFPRGTFMVSNSIVLYSNVRITGYGNNVNVTVFRVSGNKPNPFFINGKYGIGKDQGAAGYYENIAGTRLAACNIIIEKIYFDKSRIMSMSQGNNIVLQNLTGSGLAKTHEIEVCACEDVTIRNCVFNGGTLKNIAQSKAGEMLGCFEIIQLDVNTSKAFPYFGYYNGDSIGGEYYYRTYKNITIENCRFTNVFVGVGSHAYSPNIAQENIQVRGCKFYRCFVAGVKFKHVNSFSVSGCKFEECNRGIYYDGNVNKTPNETGMSDFDIMNQTINTDKYTKVRNQNIKQTQIEISGNQFKNVNSNIYVHQFQSGRNTMLDYALVQNNKLEFNQNFKNAKNLIVNYNRYANDNTKVDLADRLKIKVNYKTTGWYDDTLHNQSKGVMKY